jgi:hypothetical protein
VSSAAARFPRCAEIWNAHRAAFCAHCSCPPDGRCRVVYASEAGVDAVLDRRAASDATVPIETRGSYAALVASRRVPR